MSNSTGRKYNDLTDSEQTGMCQEFQESYYSKFCIEDIDQAFRLINPVVKIQKGKFDVWDASRSAFEKALDGIKNKPPMNSTGSKEIPEEIIELAQKLGDDYSKNKEAEFSPRSATAGMECALSMYRHLQEEKPKGMRWVKYTEGLPDEGIEVVVRKDNSKGYRYIVTREGNRFIDDDSDLHSYTSDLDWEWLDESSDDLSALRSENERLKGERDEYREALENEHRWLPQCVAKTRIEIILNKYPNPIT